MLAFKRFVTIVVMVYLLLAALFFLFPAVRTSVAELGTGTSPTENERNFYQVLALIGAVIMAVQLVVESLDSSLLRRTVSQQESKVNELKAKLYDHHAAPAAPAVGYPTAAEAAAQRPHSAGTAPGAVPPAN